MSVYARLAILLTVVLAIAGAWWKFDRMLAAADRTGYERRLHEDEAAAQAQAASNRELGRMAELHQQAVATSQQRYFTTVIKEVHDAASPLAACPVPEPVRVRLNAAAECARGESATACGADQPVPVAR